MFWRTCEPHACWSTGTEATHLSRSSQDSLLLGFLALGLKRSVKSREIRCKFVCVNDSPPPPGRGLLEPPSKSMGSKASIPKDCSKSQRLQLSPRARDLLTTSLEVILTYCYFCPISDFFSSSFLSPSAMQLFSLHGWASTNSHFCL